MYFFQLSFDFGTLRSEKLIYAKFIAQRIYCSLRHVHKYHFFCAIFVALAVALKRAAISGRFLTAISQTEVSNMLYSNITRFEVTAMRKWNCNEGTRNVASKIACISLNSHFDYKRNMRWHYPWGLREGILWKLSAWLLTLK